MSTEFPKRLPEKLKAIRERTHLSEAQFASQVKAKDAAAVAAYENGQGDLPVSVLFAYVKVAGVQLEDLIDDDRELSFSQRH